MKERATAVVEKIKNYLSEKHSPSADFYLSFTEKKHFGQDTASKLMSHKESSSVVEYLLFLYESRQFISDISTIENQLLIDFETAINNENLSFMDGAASILYYFMLVNHPECQRLTKQLAEKVNQTIEKVDRLYVGEENTDFEVVLGFEGLAGIIKVLSKSEDLAVQAIVQKGIRLFGEFKNPVIDFKKNEYSMFPRVLRTEGNKMKHINSDWLSWSVGDLGVAITTSQVAAQNQDEDLSRTAQLIGFNTILRTDTKNTLISQPFFKTGAAGLACAYQYFYKQTNIDLFRQSYEFWIEKTLDYSENLMAKNSFFDDLSILNGVTGVALVLDSYINDKDFCHDFLMAD